MLNETTVSSGENKSNFPWVYFHGEAETLMGCDLVAIDKGDLVEGIHEVTIRDLQWNALYGLSYLYNDNGRLRGYIVLADDMEARGQGDVILEETPIIL